VIKNLTNSAKEFLFFMRPCVPVRSVSCHCAACTRWRSLSREHRPTYVTGLVVEQEVTTNYLLPQACTFTVYKKKQAAEIAAVFRR
jgi:hypothetical protein